MKRILILLTAIISLSMAFIPAAFADTKIGIMNMQELLQKLPQMKQINESMKKQFGDREAKLVASQTDLKKAVEDFRKNSAVMSEKDRQAKAQKLVAQEQEIQSSQAALQKEFTTAQNKQIAALLEQIKAVVKNVADKGHYNLILINASVAYSDSSLDVTNEVLNQLLKK